MEQIKPLPSDEEPFAFNPFGKKRKFDVSHPAPKEVPDKKPTGSDDDRINTINNAPAQTGGYTRQPASINSPTIEP